MDEWHERMGEHQLCNRDAFLGKTRWGSETLNDCPRVSVRTEIYKPGICLPSAVNLWPCVRSWTIVLWAVIASLLEKRRQLFASVFSPSLFLLCFVLIRAHGVKNSSHLNFFFLEKGPKEKKKYKHNIKYLPTEVTSQPKEQKEAPWVLCTLFLSCPLFIQSFLPLNF